MTELDVIPHESRRSRKASRKQVARLNEDFQEGLLKTKIWPAAIWSLVLSICSVANPLLTPFATNLQTQNLYAGMAMMAGQNPYGDFFGTSGVLYYLLALLGHIGRGVFVFGIFQFFALLIAGIYFYKIVAYFSQSEYLATNFSHWFYIFIMTLGFGGLYAEMFALPFIFTSIWFLVRYFEHAVRDEAFILYGIDAALVFLIYPKSLILWLVAGLVLFVFNAKHRQVARGFYQILATIFGFLLILYVVGYYAFEAQILGSAIRQTFLYNLRLDFQHANLYWALAIVLGFLLLSGFFKGLIQTFLSLKKEVHGYIKILTLLTFFTQLIFIVGNVNFQWSQLVILLPYGFIMTVIHLQNRFEQERSYLRQQFFLPAFICLGIFAQPAHAYLLQGDVSADRERVASYIGEQTKEADRIYAWDTSASIYLSSRRLSSATIITAVPYLNTDENKSSLIYDFNKNEAKFVVVNKNIPILDEVQMSLKSQYEPVRTTDYFIVYQKNK
ncbi:quinol oxidase [Streptococcus ruminantium]|uniref:quinol oxidase n=1 Tax=Streptococcus ruminantium TaxID=1917441 RepID=UPI0012DD09C8|nr:quinol oxidase [Streptococcus ruminantium]BDD41726.1 glycosyltransferase [Streptococcus ruminantium]